MPIDFTKPVKTDNYDTGMLASIRAHVTALACMLEPTAAGTLTSTPTGARRINNGNGLFEYYTGSAWAEQSVAYAKTTAVATTYAPKTGVGATGTWPISVTGNAATATTLQTARTINGVSFNGSANITVADSTKLPLGGGTLTGSLSAGSDGTLALGGGNHWSAVRAYGVERASAGDLTINAFNAAGEIAVRTAGAERMRITSGGLTKFGGGYAALAGDVGIARADFPSEGIVYFSNSAGKYLYWDATKFNFVGGDVHASNFTATSDARLKRDIEQITGALAKVQQVRGVTFERIDEPGRRQTGVLAQELQAVLPEAVSTFTKDGASGGTDEYLTVNHGAVIGLLIEAIKELHGKVAALEARA